jgi:signal transduction histidine kinase
MSSAAIVIATVLALGAIAALATLWWRERRRARALAHQLRVEQDRADSASGAADAFFDLVSHEIRSPIAAIIGYQELLSDGAYGALEETTREPLHRIARSAGYLLHLVDGTVDLARDRVGSLRTHLEDVPLRRVIEDAAQVFCTNAQERALACSSDVDPGIPDVRSDRERLQRILDLMLYAAVKHPDSNGLELRAEAQPDGATVRVRGIRIPTRPDASDPALRVGIRIAIVAATATALGGDLRLECAAEDAANEMVLRIRASPRA